MDDSLSADSSFEDSLGSPPALTSSSPSLDSRGVLRGRCAACSSCPNFQKSQDTCVHSCGVCGHPPVKHINLSSSNSSSSTNLPSQPQEDMSFHSFLKTEREEDSEDEGEEEIEVDGGHVSHVVVCSVPGCGRETYFDINTGYSGNHCLKHSRTRGSPYDKSPTSSPGRPFSRARTACIQRTPPLNKSLHTGAVPFKTGASMATPSIGGDPQPSYIQNVPVPPTFLQSIPSTQSHSHSSLHSARPLRVSVSLCKLPGCNKPAFINPDTNESFDCCGRTHGRQYQAMMAETTIDPSMKCSNPDCSRPKYQEKDGTVHNFCGLSCRDNFESKRVKVIPRATSENMCMLPGCSKPCYTDPRTGTILSYCGQSHATQATTQIFLELPSKSAEYDNVLKHFDKQWVKNRPPPSPILGIMKINNDQVKATFQTYKDSISSKREWHFHGTSLHCNLLTTKTPCSNSKCGVCGIARRGFDLKTIGSNIPHLQRFGQGFYLAPNSSKCHDYTQGHATYRAMILCDVAPGNKHIVKNNQEKLKRPPSGCHSVYGSHGSALNYDEIVLYNSHAICPQYVIFYTRDNIGKIAQ